ncbi:hypothetical protein [Glycomyces niveus]|uniref:Uncharacterized protein n=1 Tax=Glycomyces niveus TaxID=2820287 RepID=A0ABS3U8A3_9ACTN|nr:hypothetical protein [Glycomyces sp. NEAU-S30]MBO3734991.1 hypothetical protein [Glycomyces sp. NEAU-S30]
MTRTAAAGGGTGIGHVNASLAHRLAAPEGGNVTAPLIRSLGDSPAGR